MVSASFVCAFCQCFCTFLLSQGSISGLHLTLFSVCSDKLTESIAKPRCASIGEGCRNAILFILLYRQAFGSFGTAECIAGISTQLFAVVSAILLLKEKIHRMSCCLPASQAHTLPPVCCAGRVCVC